MKLKTLIDKIECKFVLYQGRLIPSEYNKNYLEEKVSKIDWWKDEEKLIIYLKLESDK